jgi:hypothetical protein
VRANEDRSKYMVKGPQEMTRSEMTDLENKFRAGLEGGDAEILTEGNEKKEVTEFRYQIFEL